MTRHLRGEVTGLDQSDAMLEVAAGQVPEATFVQGDALDLPFDDGAFDCSSRATSTATSRRTTASASSPRPGGSHASS